MLLYIQTCAALESSGTAFNQTSCTSDSFNLLKTTTTFLEQFFVLFIVACIWIAPNGQLTVDQFSQQLLTYLGIGADILDILDYLDEIISSSITKPSYGPMVSDN